MTLRFEEIPNISAKASLEELVETFNLIVEDYKLEDTFQFDQEDGLLVLHSTRNELAPQKIAFPQSMLCINTHFPMFLLATDHIVKTEKQFLNHWEIMYWLLDSRLQALAKYDHIYSGFIYKDINLINNFVFYTTPNSYNAKVKENNVCVIVNCYHSGNTRLVLKSPDDTLGNWLFANPLSAFDMKEVLAHLNILPGSETMLASASKVVMYNGKDDFKAPGYKVVLDKDGNVDSYISIFPPKQNVPSRWKTHLHGEAYQYINNHEAIFSQDTIETEDSVVVTKDNTLQDMVVVFESIDEETFRLGAGEIEVSKEFAEQVVVISKHRELQLDEIEVEEGYDYTPKKGSNRIVIGTHDGEKRSIDMVDRIYVSKVERTGFSNGVRIEYLSYHRAINCRITSQTGFKGMTKCMADLGTITFGEERIAPTAICSINSLKGKMNTIRLAQAALAYRLGLYTPKNGKYLNSYDEDEINEAVSSLPKFTHTRNGKVVEDAKIGIIQASVTELGSMYARLKQQTFPFAALKYLEQQDNTDLAKYVAENHIDEQSKTIVMELKKILEDSKGILQKEEGEDGKVIMLPTYALDKLSKVFSEKDIIVSRRSILPINSKLLDEEFNKGFYISCAPVGKEMIRIPPASILNKLCGQLQNGEYVYPDILINISKIILACLPKNGQTNYHFVTHYTKEESKTRTTARQAYLTGCYSMLYSEESFGQRMIKTLLNPEMYGIGLKQVFDEYVPDNVVVVLNNNVYNQFAKHAFEGTEQGSRRIEAFSIRNPFLWIGQLTKTEVWNEAMFKRHLAENHGIELHKYLIQSLNQYCVLVGKSTIQNHHSDCDGDLVSICIPNGLRGQDLLNDFTLKGIYPKMIKWDEEYIKGEVSSNEDIDWSKKYKLYTIPKVRKGRNYESYVDFLVNASEAKNAIGSATNDCWIVYMLAQIYTGLKKDGREETKLQFNRNEVMTLTTECMQIIDYTYIRLIEEGVVNAIKHVENGAMGFQKYYLSSISNPQSDKKIIVNELVSKFDMSREEAITLLKLIVWAGETGYLTACKKFLQMHNKGVVCEDKAITSLFPDIVNYTFLGNMFKNFYNINNVIEEKRLKIRSQYQVKEAQNASSFVDVYYG